MTQATSSKGGGDAQKPGTDPTAAGTGPGRVALVTGSGRQRLGNHIVRALSADGYRVAVHYHRSADSAQELVTELRAAGGTAEAFAADIRSVANIQRLIAEVVECWGRLDVLVNTASVWRPIVLEAITEQDLQDQFDVDLKGTFFCSQLAGLQMVRQPEGGAIVNFGDWALERPYPQHSAYFAVKGAIPSLTRTLARELAERNPRVRVNCILPGPVLLPPNVDEEEHAVLLRSTLVRQVDRPDSIVRAVRYLVTDDFITGVCLPVDGGRTIYAAGEDR